MRRLSGIVSLALLFLTAPRGWSVSVMNDENAEADRWIAAKFEGKSERKPAEGHLMVYVKSGQVQKNQMGGHSLRIVNQEYQRGLYCPSEGQIVVHLPEPAKSFEVKVDRALYRSRVSGFAELNELCPFM